VDGGIISVFERKAKACHIGQVVVELEETDEGSMNEGS
jgi:hypothetical protein